MKRDDNERVKSGKGRGDDNECKREVSPLSNLYNYPMWPNPSIGLGYMPYPGFAPGGFHFVSGGGAYNPSMGNSQRGGNSNMRNGYYRGEPRSWRPKGACLFCESPSHMVRDCEKMKAARKK